MIVFSYSAIGKRCSEPDMTVPPECPIDGIRCDAATSTCQCDEGQGWSLFDNRCIIQGNGRVLLIKFMVL